MVLLVGILKKREQLCIGGNVMPSVQTLLVSDSASIFYIMIQTYVSIYIST